MSDARFEMLWDCPGCGSKGLLGLTHRHCPSCGAPQDPSRRYFPTDDQKVAVADHPFVGSDRACPACDTANAARADFCGGCGAPMAGARAVVVRGEQVAGGEGFEKDSAESARREASAARDAARAAKVVPPAPPKRSWLPFAVGAVALGGLACAILAFVVFGKHDATVELTGHQWKRVVQVEEFATVTETAWRDQMPVDARLPTCREEERSTRKVADGESCSDVRTDNGDGTYSTSQRCTTNYREEPVYDTRCTFTVDRWRSGREARAEGAGVTPAPAWPEVSLRAGTGLGAEREAARSESYTLTFRDEEARSLACEVEEARWAALADGSRWLAPVGRFVESIDCSGLRAP